MPSGGHNRKPKDRKIIQGTWRMDRNPAREPDPAPVDNVPKPPSHLNRWGKRFWKQELPQLVQSGIMRSTDLRAFEVLCEFYGQYREAREAVYCFVVDDSGRRRHRTLAEYMHNRNSQTAPEYTAMTKALASFRGACAEFGMNPVGRNRIDITPLEEEQDPLEKMIYGD